MNNKSLVFIIGKTSSGKDTIARYIEEHHGIKPICSYATRPKRESETDGVEHYFITKERMKQILENEDVLAYVNLNGIEYCSTVQGMTEDTMLYIIDPAGIEFFEKSGFNIRYKSIYVYLDESIIRQRALKRGDNEDVFMKRLNGERDLFDNYFKSGKYDFLIDTNRDLSDVYTEVDKIMNKIKLEWG